MMRDGRLPPDNEDIPIHKTFRYNTLDQKDINIMRKTIFSIYGLIALCALIAMGVMGYYVYETFTSLDDIKARAIELYSWGNDQNEFATAGVSLWLLGVLTYLARDIPNKIWRFVVKQTTVTLTLNNCDNVYDNFLAWYHETGRSKKSRTLVASNHYNNEKNKYETRISSGYGLHFFTFGGKIFTFSRAEKDASMTKETKESIELKTIGRSQAQFLDLIEEVTPSEEKDEVTDIFRWSTTDHYWKRQGEQASRRFDSVILPQKTKDDITHHIETFLAEREWYLEKGIPYRTGIVLHGVPGTGKTSLVRGICERFDKSLYVINLNTLTDQALEEAFGALPRGSVVLMEDIDTYSITNERKEGVKPSSAEAMSEVIGGLTLSGLLNAIDGIVASDGRILIATTNHLEKLDPALIRKGRFNLSVNINYLSDECFRKFFEIFYPNFPISPTVDFKTEMSPAELQALIIDNRDNPAYVLSQCVIAPTLTVANTAD